MPRTGAARTNTLGRVFLGDNIYPLAFTFSHSGATLKLDLRSILFEGKGIAEESWGLDNVRVAIASNPPPTSLGARFKD
jgi:hypothetical protein